MREARDPPRTRLDSPTHNAIGTETGHRSGRSPTCQTVVKRLHLFLESIANIACNPDVNFHNVEAHSLGLALRLYPRSAAPCPRRIPARNHKLMNIDYCSRTTNATRYPVVGSMGLPIHSQLQRLEFLHASVQQDPPTLAGRSPARPCWKRATLGLRLEAPPHLRATCSW